METQWTVRITTNRREFTVSFLESAKQGMINWFKTHAELVWRNQGATSQLETATGETLFITGPIDVYMWKSG